MAGYILSSKPELALPSDQDSRSPARGGKGWRQRWSWSWGWRQRSELEGPREAHHTAYLVCYQALSGLTLYSGRNSPFDTRARTGTDGVTWCAGVGGGRSSGKKKLPDLTDLGPAVDSGFPAPAGDNNVQMSRK
ncbi:unnamed protein product [Protopolystoma xenopodis]|uniref:Uncharacterized protein n=1 Tax=Protopolystoma xenopodis TaxID=117903 RepID=A0A3S5CV95_9PLAT|nr:unnamed protein product [Protopolystoma xenopodis]